eukprot:15341079-Ditylum_brightwellii.AAC.1
MFHHLPPQGTHNIVNTPTSKALEVILSIFPLTHGTDPKDFHSVTYSLYKLMTPSSPMQARCATYTQISKRYGVTFRYWTGYPFYWVFSKCNASTQYIRVADKTSDKITVGKDMS